MKIKVIDLLNKIANGEEVPKKIKYNIIWNFDEEIKDYVSECNGESFFNDEFDNNWIFKNMNDEIQIIEDTPKKIEKIDRIGNDYYHKEQNEINQIFQRKINEIIDYLNKGE